MLLRAPYVERYVNERIRVMDYRPFLAVIGISLIAHIFLGNFASKEVADYPLITIKQKTIWQINNLVSTDSRHNTSV